MREKGKAVAVNRIASAFTMYFSEGPVTNMIESGNSDATAYASYWRQMLAQGIYLAPAGFELRLHLFRPHGRGFREDARSGPQGRVSRPHPARNLTAGALSEHPGCFFAVGLPTIAEWYFSLFSLSHRPGCW